MGYLSNLIGRAALTNIVNQNPPAGFLGYFGNGGYQVFGPGTLNFTVPVGVTQIRARVVGGGAGGNSSGVQGGGGGGFALGTFPVTPGQVLSVTVGAAGAINGNGGTSSIAALISASGGLASGAGGSGTGGQFQANGGAGGATPSGGGGGAGSQLGVGGNGGINLGGGGGVGGGNGGSNPGGGGSPFGTAVGPVPSPSILAVIATNAASPIPNPINAQIRFPFDGFVGGGAAPGGATGTGTGGIGGGGAGGGFNGGIGGGGGAGNSGGSLGGAGSVVIEW